MKQSDITLITTEGKELVIKIPQESFEEVWEEIQIMFACQGMWWCSDYVDLDATYLNKHLDHIDFKKIIGITI